QGFRVLAGATLIAPSSSWTSSSGTPTTDMESQVFFPPHAYVSYGDPSGWTFGIGFYAPFGLGTEWPPDWTGRYSAVKADLQSFYINPTVAYKFSEQFSLGVGGSYVFSDVELSQRVPTSTTAPSPSTDGDLRLKADATAFNFNAGLLFKPSTQWSIGVSYRHSTELKYEGDATFSNMGALGFFFPGGTGKTEITFPNNIFAGVAYQATDKLIIEADFQYIMWSTYDTLKIVMPVGPSTPPPPLGTGQPLQGPQALPKDWDDAWMIRIGGEYQLETVALRAGFIYDKTPQPEKSVEPLLPDANRIEFTIGVGFQISENVVVDAAYQLILSEDRTAPPSTSPSLAILTGGTYKSTAHLFGLSLGFNM
ncbi:MAG: outer membrane protein transport protein, partial [Bacteroidetes bacterium]|nr:outer membrane protein transport protein [Bacteroidota bacterium]